MFIKFPSVLMLGGGPGLRSSGNVLIRGQIIMFSMLASTSTGPTRRGTGVASCPRLPRQRREPAELLEVLVWTGASRRSP